MGDKKKSPVGRIFLTVLCVLLGLILVAVIAAVVFIGSIFDNLQQIDTSVPTLSSSEIQRIEDETDPLDPDFTGPVYEDVTWPTETVPVIEKEDHVFNILLIGQDRREGQGRQRSDAMILCTLNLETKTLTMTSFMRDLYVQIPGYRDNRMNAAYQFGGMPLLNDTLMVNFGVQVDGNIEVDFEGFAEIVDILGGVSIELTGTEAGYLNNGKGWRLKSGTNLLTGEQALAYSRIRYIKSNDTSGRADSDYGRTYRQRQVLTSLINSCKNSNLTTLMSLLDPIMDIVATDMSEAQIVEYAMEVFPILSELKIVTQRIPADGTYEGARIRGMSVLIPDLEANRQLLLDSIMKE